MAQGPRHRCPANRHAPPPTCQVSRPARREPRPVLAAPMGTPVYTAPAPNQPVAQRQSAPAPIANQSAVAAVAADGGSPPKDPRIRE
eukprot:12090262-Alexandrium_andersonii.AAC.1